MGIKVWDAYGVVVKKKEAPHFTTESPRISKQIKYEIFYYRYKGKQ